MNRLDVSGRRTGPAPSGPSAASPRRISGANGALKEISQEMADELHELVCAERARLKQTLPWLDTIRSIDDTRAYVCRRLCLQSEKKGLTYLILMPGKIAGVVSVDNLGSAEPFLGYWLSKAYEGMGVATLSVSKLCRIVFQHYGLDRVFIRCGTRNFRSQAVARRCGFKFIETRYGAEDLYGKIVDHHVYVRARDESGI